MMFLTAFVGAFIFNFICNLAFPAVSPRIYLKDLYKTEIKGLFFANIIRGALTSAASNTFSAFPSGHCGISWLTSLLAYRMGYRTYSLLSFIAAILITIATLILRYHYFVDALFATMILLFGMFFGGFTTQESFQQNLQMDEQSKELTNSELPLV